MYNFFNKIVRLFCLCVFLFGHSSADAQNKELPVDINPYFGPVGKQRTRYEPKGTVGPGRTPLLVKARQARAGLGTN